MKTDRSHAFHHVDVFTDTSFQGNPLAVFPDGRGIDGTTMQRIARELNLSETTFILPAQNPDHAAKVRIFTPATELQFAGHPTIGTSFVLWSTGAVAHARNEILLEEGIGTVPVRIEPSERFMAWLTTPPITFGETFAGAPWTAALGLEKDDLLSGAPVQAVSAGNPFIYVPLRSEEAVDRATCDMAGFRKAGGAAAASSGIYFFALRRGGVYSRMFAPEYGIIEDPATGSATGPLAAYLLEHRLIEERDGLRLTSEQGTKMGRRSILHILISGVGKARRIEVGGNVVPLIQATLTLH
ncbi:MAG: PhzF family phenazine biosynthesis protein [Candidatus Eremiobacteraeota bacterium]|nr:PhzF family phenazine biosynthesis protein [Candidatus Eremiobacteraeota bacterium]MBC5826171.1 PhzF family phenazine biosynthesis protein [Candidatus Eremiobacteraeota bacterium]